LKLLNAIFKRLQSYRANKDLHDDYIKCLFRHDKISTFKLKNNIIRGKIIGVNADGLLIVAFKKQFKKFNLKEIQMIL
jgi:biotin-(acetyl-CoA carboxylase) ligase